MANGSECRPHAFNELAQSTNERLKAFQVLVGEANFPRVFVDIIQHLSSIQIKAPTIQDEIELDKSLEGCARQLAALHIILDRCIPGGKDAGKKGVAKALKDIYTEKELPRIQKTLHGYEMSMG